MYHLGVGRYATLERMDFQRLLEVEAGKALPAHPALQGSDPVSVYAPGGGAARTDATLTQREASRHLDAYGGDQAIDWVMDCVDLYGETAADAAFHLEKDGKRVRLDSREEGDGPIIDPILKILLEQPNPYMPWTELIHLLVADLLLVGNAYWYKFKETDGRPLALYRLAPSHVKIIPATWGPKSYEYQPPGAKDPLAIDPAQIVHFKRPNPHSAFYGLGVIQGGGRPFDLELALTDTQASYFENKADPSLVVQSERRIPRDVFNKLRAQLRSRVSGPRRAGELLVLESGLKAETLSTSAKDALFDILTRLSRDRIFAMFRTNPMLLGIIDESAGQTKLPDVERHFTNNVIKPFLRRLALKMTVDLFRAWGYDFKYDHRYIMPEEELVKLSGDFGSIPGVKVKEVRQFLVDGDLLEEATTGDKTIDDTVLNLPGEELDEDGQGGFADRNLPREPGRPPKGSSTRAFPRAGQPLPAKARARQPQGKAMTAEEALERLNRIPAGKAFEKPDRVSIGNKLTGEDRPEDTLAGVRDSEIDTITASLRADLLDATHTLERGLLDHVEGKAFEPGSLLRRVRNSESWKSFSSMASAALERGAERAVALAAVQHGTAKNILPAEELDYEEIAKSVVYRPEGVRGISKNLKNEIVQKVGRALEEGAERGDVDQIIRESIDFWRSSHAETVALTEAVHAYNEGTLSVAEAAGLTTVMVSDGHDHDEPCIEADGSVWAIDFARENRLEHPRCRRAFVPLVG